MTNLVFILSDPKSTKELWEASGFRVTFCVLMSMFGGGGFRFNICTPLPICANTRPGLFGVHATPTTVTELFFLRIRQVFLGLGFVFFGTVDSRFNDEKFCPSNNKVLKITPDLTAFFCPAKVVILIGDCIKIPNLPRMQKNTLLITMHENFQFASSEKISILHKCR